MEEGEFRATKGIRVRCSVWTVSRDMAGLIPLFNLDLK